MAAAAKRKHRRYSSGGEVDEDGRFDTSDSTYRGHEYMSKQLPDAYERGGTETGVLALKNPPSAPSAPVRRETKDSPAWIPQQLPVAREKYEFINPKWKTDPMKKGGKIRHTSGPPIGREDGLIAAQRGEYVIRKSAVKKLGTKVLDQVNRGKLPARKGKR